MPQKILINENSYENDETSIKLGEIQSNSNINGSERIIELHYQGKKNQKGFKNPVDFNLVSLPDHKELCGSWRLLMNLDSPMFSERDLMKKKFRSDREILITQEDNKIEDFKKKKDTLRLKLIAIDEQNELNNGLVFNMQNDQGEMIKITNENQNHFFEKIYQELMMKDKETMEREQPEMEFDFEPKEAMFMLNQSFHLEVKSINIESLPQSQKNIKNASLSGPGGMKSFLPSLSRKGTIKGYRKKSSRFGSIHEKGRSFQQPRPRGTLNGKALEIKCDLTKISETPDKRKSETDHLNPFLRLMQPAEAKDSPDRLNVISNQERSKRSLSLYSRDDRSETNLSSTEEEEEEEGEGEGEREIQVKVEIEVKKEFWLSLRMGPVLSYAHQIRINLEDMGYEIKFIEDMHKIKKEKEKLLDQNEQNKKQQQKRKQTLPTKRNSIIQRFQTQNSKVFEQPRRASFQFINLKQKQENALQDDWHSLEQQDKIIKYYDIKKQMKNGKVLNLSYKEVNEMGEAEEDQHKKEEQEQILNQKSLGSKIIKYHNLLKEMCDHKSDYITRFDNEKKFQQMLKMEKKQLEKNTKKQSQFMSIFTPNSSNKNINEFDFKSINSRGSEMTKNFLSNGGSESGLKEFRTNSQVKREEEYDRIFNHLDNMEEQNQMENKEVE